MTESQLRNQVVATARSWIGLKESNGSHKTIIDVYNNHKPLAQGYKVKYTDSWCATFISAVMIKSGITDIAPTECSCPRMVALYQKMGRWKENDAYVPSPGDIVMYDWQDSGVGDNTGDPDHVGIVESVSGNVIHVIEGNLNDAVGRRNLSVNGKYIRGFCLPDYASKAGNSTDGESNSSGDKTAAGNESGGQTTTKINPEPAKEFSKTFAKTYTVTASALNMRRGAGTTKGIIKTLKKGEEVTCFGYYTKVLSTIWLYVRDSSGTIGYCSKNYLE